MYLMLDVLSWFCDVVESDGGSTMACGTGGRGSWNIILDVERSESDSR